MKLRPIGFGKMCKECNSLDKMPSKKVRKWKRGEKQKIKKEWSKQVSGRCGNTNDC